MQAAKNIEKIFEPKSVALIGATNRPMAVGSTIAQNLLKANFKGKIYFVNPKGEEIFGVKAYKDIASLPEIPDVAILGINPKLIPSTLQQLKDKGNRAAVIISAGLNEKDPETGVNYQEESLKIAHSCDMRLVGPNCLGVLVPHIGYNGSFSAAQAHDGDVAFISQSGALCCSVLDWAYSRTIGFSYFASIGDMAEVNFTHILPFLANDPKTKAIFLYVEQIKDPEAFVQIAREVSKKKPIFAIKSGRSEEGAAAAVSHTGALAGGDNVYDAAFERAGVIRIEDLNDMYATLELLSRKDKVKDASLTILTNGGGPGVLAVDCLAKHGGHLTKLSAETKKKLDAVLPPTWSHGNPVDIIGDADGTRYQKALEILLDAPEVGDVMVLYVPTGISSGLEVAEKMVETETKRKTGKVFGAWVGQDVCQPGIDHFKKNGVPCFDSSENAVKGFMYFAQASDLRSKREKLDQNAPKLLPVDKKGAQDIMSGAKKDGRFILTELEARRVFELYNIPVSRIRFVTTATEAETVAKELLKTASKLVVKIVSKDIVHKSDVGGVALSLTTPEAVKEAFERMFREIPKALPKAKLEGVIVSEMVVPKPLFEVLIGVTKDPVFGKVMLVGAGGVSVEVVKDTSIALLPLNEAQAMDALMKTRMYQLMKGYRDVPAADTKGVIQTMLQVSKLIADFPEINEVDVNPLLVDAKDGIAVDARIVLEK